MTNCEELCFIKVTKISLLSILGAGLTNLFGLFGNLPVISLRLTEPMRCTEMYHHSIIYSYIMPSPLTNLLYIFQSEHYDRIRFLKFVYKNLNWFSFSVRGNLDWTLRAKLIFLISVSFYGLDILGTYFITQKIYLALLVVLFGYFFFPLYIIIADFIISPLVRWKKKKITQQARKLVDSSGVKIIGITGSYGKTTMKTILQSILKEQFSVMTLPGNINTDLGVANYVLSNQSELDAADILIVEMGAYKMGEIKNICEVTPPHYSVLTAVAPVHLERFGSLENIAKAKWEIVENAQNNAFVNQSITNDKLQITNIVEFVDLSGENIAHTFLPEFSGIEFEIEGRKYQTQLIAHHVLGMIGLGIKIAEELGTAIENIQKGVKNIPAVPHRLEIIKNEKTGVTVIDDSYNGNFDGFISGLKTLARAGGRKVVLTPGIVELGEMQEQVHRELAQYYISEKLDVVLLIENSNTAYIIDELIKRNFKNYKTYSSVFKAHEDLKNILEKGDTILFQNDLSDNYR